MAVPGRASLRALLTANAISLTGNKMTLLVIPWFVLETTGSPSRTALAGFFAFLPIPLSSLLGGPLIATSWMAIPLGVLAGGGMIEAWGLRPTLIVIASLYLATVLTALINPGTKDLNRTSSDRSGNID